MKRSKLLLLNAATTPITAAPAAVIDDYYH